MSTEELNDIIAFLESLKKAHYVNYEDCWYSCPLAKTPDGDGECCNDEDVEKGECTCGADHQHELIDTKISELKSKHS